MALQTRLHPVLQYLHILLCGLAATATIVVSWMVNPHSAAWLFDLYICTILLIASLRKVSKSSLHKSYTFYLSQLILYFLIVWFLHFAVPGPNPKDTEKFVMKVSMLICIGSIYMPLAIYHFTLRFAQADWAPLRWIEYAGWIVFTIFSISNFLGCYYGGVVWTGHTWVPTMSGLYPQFFYCTTFYITVGMLVPMVMVFKSPSRKQRLQLFYFLLGGFPLWLSCWGHFLMALGINIYPAGGFMFLLHALIMAYAVFKERVFDLTIAVRRGLAYAILSVLVGMLYGAVLWGLSIWTESLHAGLISGFIFVFLVGLLYAPFLSYLQAAVDRLFFREAANRQRMIELFAHETAATIDLDSLTRALCNLVERSLKPRRTNLFLDDGKGAFVHFCSQDGQYAPGQWPAGPRLPSQYMTVNGHAQRVHAQENAVAVHSIQMTEGNEALVVPIVHRNQRLGCLLLEPKRADEPYDDEDVRLAEAIAAQSAVALQNARSFAQLERHQNLARVGEAISSLNHEIKNVLQPVRHQVDRLAALQTSDPVVNRAMSIIPDRLAALDRLLSNLKDLSRPIELRIREIDLDELTASVWRDIQELPVARAVQFKATIDSDARQCRADGHWLRQVLYNLARNSVEATAGREKPEVSIESKRGDDHSKILVKDNGCGMDEAAQKRLFSLFYSTKGEGGTGLGLSISRKIIELHGGMIEVASAPGEGTCVTLSLPVRDQALPERP